MFEIADRLLAAVDAGRTLAVATAISIEGSAPRTVGTSMGWDGESVIGSIAGGCVEGAVVEVAQEVLASGVARTVEFGVTDEDAFAVGLTCGGIIRIHVQLLDATVEGSLRSGADVEVCREFSEKRPTERRMIVFGAMEFSAALALAAGAMGYRVTVVDPRPLFATPVRFPTAEVVVTWPTTYLETTVVDEHTVICVLSHDARYDAELIAQALALPVAYVGAMGSRNTHDRRVASLLERGVSPDSLAGLHSPIGLDLGASSPEETAISILAEILAARTDTTALPLTVLEGSIHGRRAVRA